MTKILGHSRIGPMARCRFCRALSTFKGPYQRKASGGQEIVILRQPRRRAVVIDHAVFAQHQPLAFPADREIGEIGRDDTTNERRSTPIRTQAPAVLGAACCEPNQHGLSMLTLVAHPICLLHYCYTDSEKTKQKQ